MENNKTFEQGFDTAVKLITETEKMCNKVYRKGYVKGVFMGVAGLLLVSLINHVADENKKQEESK